MMPSAKSWLLIAAILAPAGSSAADDFVRPLKPVVALTRIRVIDGTGRAGKDDQTVIVRDGRIVTLGPSHAVKIPAGAETLDLTGRTVIPGLVGMHEHLFYQLQPADAEYVVPAQRTFARLYLASGVTTIRTAGTMDFEADAALKRRIDSGKEAGPRIHLTAPYLQATSASPDPDGIARQVAAYADRGATSFKAYTSLRTSELKAAIRTAHERGLTVTGHLCAVGFREAAVLGIDNLEHGLTFDSEFHAQKRPDECPNLWEVFAAVIRMESGDADLRRTIDALVGPGVAITSTLAVIESFAIDEKEIDRRLLPVLSPRLHDTFQQARDRRKDRRTAGQAWWAEVLRKEMAFERQFVRTGGKLLAGADPTGWGGVLAGYGDQRQLELLVAAGFSAEEAIAIATSNGAAFLKDRTVGTIAEGMKADLVVLKGDPSRDISVVRSVELVFKDGIAYEPDKLVAAVAGTLGGFTIAGLFTWPINLVLALLVGRRATRVLRNRRGSPSTG